MRSPIVAALLGLVSPTNAQDPPAAGVQPVGQAQAIARAVCLQSHPDSDGLLGLGAAYLVRFRVGEVRYDVAQAPDAANAFVSLSAPVVSRGSTVLPTFATVAPIADGRRAVYRRADGVDERYDLAPDAIELSWSFAERPAGAGDLVVHYSVTTTLGAPTVADDGLRFEGAACGVRIGKVTGIAADGARADGTVQWDGTGVRFTLPAAFVDAAAYPLVLDPVLGSTFLVENTAAVSVNLPRAAYDATTDRWLVSWLRYTGNPGLFALVTQLVDGATGALVGNAFIHTMQAEFSHGVANHGQRDEFGIAFARRLNNLTAIEFARIAATTGQVLFGITVATANGLDTVNIGAQVEPTAAGVGFTVTYRDFSAGLAFIRARRISYIPMGIMVGPIVTLWADTGTTQFGNVSMSRAAAADGRLLAVARRKTGTNYAIVGIVLDAGSDVPGASQVLEPDTTAVLGRTAVDGYAGRWVVAFERPGSSALPGQGVRVRPVAVDSASGTLLVGVGTSFGGLATNQASSPSVGYSLGRTWLGYKSAGATLSGTTTHSVRAAALDTGTCVSCFDSFSASQPSSVSDSSIATMTSGGVPGGEDAMFVWSDYNTGTNLLAQRLRAYGTNGTAANLGGACGATGTVAFDHAPGIGSGGFRCRLNGIPTTALLPIFNFGPPSTTVPCGACVWTPFAVTQVAAIAGGSASVEFPIPCLTALVGQQFETQWTLVDFAQAPCPVFPGFALSNRSLLTIGN